MCVTGNPLMRLQRQKKSFPFLYCLAVTTHYENVPKTNGSMFSNRRTWQHHLLCILSYFTQVHLLTGGASVLANCLYLNCLCLYDKQTSTA